MNTLSLFDGMSCGKIALERVGIEGNYYSSEIDKYAINVSKDNYPDIISLGDITKWREWDIDWSSIDLLMGGSPCQGFSFAGKQLAFDDPRSKLFFVYVDILNHIKSLNPNVKFLLENVKMKKEHINVISEILGVESIFINSNKILPIDRPRHYWCNWYVNEPSHNGKKLTDYIDFKDKSFRSDSFHAWLNKKLEWKIKKKYISIMNDAPSAIPQLARQVASWNGNIVRVSSGKYRFLNIKEASSLHGVPVNYFDSVSSAQAYKMLGNGWQIDTIVHLLQGLKNELK